MTKLEVLKSMLEDPQLMQAAGLTEEDISKINLSPMHANDMVALIQQMVNRFSANEYTVATAAANLNSFLDTRLAGKS